MKQERVVLSFIMVLIGLLVAGVAFYFYQTTKVIPDKSNTSNVISPTPTLKPTIFLSLSQPGNESVVASKTLKISGKKKNSFVKRSILAFAGSDFGLSQSSSVVSLSAWLTACALCWLLMIVIRLFSVIRRVVKNKTMPVIVIKTAKKSEILLARFNRMRQKIYKL